MTCHSLQKKKKNKSTSKQHSGINNGKQKLGRSISNGGKEHASGGKKSKNLKKWNREGETTEEELKIASRETKA